MAEPLVPPDQWGDDDLTKFLTLAARNRFATFAKKRPIFQRLIDIDRCFMVISDGWLNPQNTLAPTFFFRTHSAFRAACEHATSGQATETYPLVRVLLEYAGYALHIHKHPELAIIWLDRHKDEAGGKAVRNSFQVREVRTSVEAANREAGKVFALLYERAIDFGAHPNERSVTGSMTMTDKDDRTEIQQLYLHGDGLAMDLALKSVAQAGVCALQILQEVFPARFELLGVKHEVIRLRQGL